MGIQQVFNASAPTAGTGWQVWTKPRGVSFVHFFALGGGGGGGGGSVGGNSTAGGGGGASSNQCSLTFPAWLLPDRLYISVGYGGAGGTAPAGTGGTGVASYVSIYSANTANYLLASVIGGNGAVAGAAGTINGVATVALTNALRAGLAFMPRLLLATNMALVNQPGTAGGGVGAGVALTLPTTGLVVTGGTGGGGMGTVASSTGSAGGAFTVPAGGVFPPQIGGIAGGAQASSGGPGSNGLQVRPNLQYYYGGTGGASAGGTSGTGGRGGAGAYGCGGGGGGAAVTGQVAGNGGKGGDGLVIITAW